MRAGRRPLPQRLVRADEVVLVAEALEALLLPAAPSPP